jgi:hypothetical protein
MTKNIKFSINDGGEFFAHETSVQFSPTQFIVDFKSITPRVDPRTQEGQVYSIKHNVVLLEPYHAVKMVDLLQRIVKKYEKEFGKITIPKALAIAEKKRPKTQKKEKTEAPHYLG